MGKLVAVGGADIGHPHCTLIIEKILELVGDKKDKKMIYLPTGGRDTKEDEQFIKEFFTARGFETRSLYLTDMGLSDEYIKNAILGADLIYACGGNLKFLLETWRKRKADVYLRQAYENGTVLAGNSSGAMCWFRHGWDDCGENGAFMFMEGLDIFPYCFCPHFQNEKWHKFTEAVKMQEFDGLGVDDSTALVFEDGKVSVIKNDPKPENSAFIMPAANNYALEDLALRGDRFFL